MDKLRRKGLSANKQVDKQPAKIKRPSKHNDRASKNGSVKSTRQASIDLSRINVLGGETNVDVKLKPIPRTDPIPIDVFIWFKEGQPLDYIFDEFIPWCTKRKQHAAKTYDEWMRLYDEYSREKNVRRIAMYGGNPLDVFDYDDRRGKVK